MCILFVEVKRNEKRMNLNIGFSILNLLRKENRLNEFF